MERVLSTGTGSLIDKKRKLLLTAYHVLNGRKEAAVFFVQTAPFDGTLHHDIRAAVYGPAYLGPKGD